VKTDFTPHPPHDNYTATLELRGTKEEFEELYNFLVASDLREHKDSKVVDNVLNELEEVIQHIGDCEPYGV
jgi:hypothetical protein